MKRQILLLCVGAFSFSFLSAASQALTSDSDHVSGHDSSLVNVLKFFNSDTFFKNKEKLSEEDLLHDECRIKKDELIVWFSDFLSKAKQMRDRVQDDDYAMYFLGLVRRSLQREENPLSKGCVEHICSLGDALLDLVASEDTGVLYGAGCPVVQKRDIAQRAKRIIALLRKSVSARPENGGINDEKGVYDNLVIIAQRNFSNRIFDKNRLSAWAGCFERAEDYFCEEVNKRRRVQRLLKKVVRATSASLSDFDDTSQIDELIRVTDSYFRGFRGADQSRVELQTSLVVKKEKIQEDLGRRIKNSLAGAIRELDGPQRLDEMEWRCKNISSALQKYCDFFRGELPDEKCRTRVRSAMRDFYGCTVFQIERRDYGYRNILNECISLETFFITDNPLKEWVGNVVDDKDRTRLHSKYRDSLYKYCSSFSGEEYIRQSLSEKRDVLCILLSRLRDSPFSDLKRVTRDESDSVALLIKEIDRLDVVFNELCRSTQSAWNLYRCAESLSAFEGLPKKYSDFFDEVRRSVLRSKKLRGLYLSEKGLSFSDPTYVDESRARQSIVFMVGVIKILAKESSRGRKRQRSGSGLRQKSHIKKRHALLELLGMSTGDSYDVFLKNARSIKREYHPDKGGSTELFQNVTYFLGKIEGEKTFDRYKSKGDRWLVKKENGEPERYKKLCQLVSERSGGQERRKRARRKK